jgi:hypothetical protein
MEKSSVFKSVRIPIAASRELMPNWAAQSGAAPPDLTPHNREFLLRMPFYP